MNTITTPMDALTAIKNRISCRDYSEQTVPVTLIEQIIDAGRMAATARNEQPWEFVIFSDEMLRRQIASMTENGSFIAHAPICIGVFCMETKYYVEDGSAATQNMLVAATALGVSSCWIAGDKKPYASQIAALLSVPPTYKLVSMVTLGYAKTEKPRARKRALDEVIHWNRF